MLHGIRQRSVDDQRPPPEVGLEKRAVQRVAAERTRDVPRVIRRRRENQTRVRRRRDIQLLVRVLLVEASSEKAGHPAARRGFQIVHLIAAFATFRGVLARLFSSPRGVPRPRPERVLRRAVLDHLAHVLLHELVVVQRAVVVVLETLVPRVVVIIFGIVVVVAAATEGNAAGDASGPPAPRASVRAVQPGHLEPGQTRVGLGVAHRGEHRGERPVGFLAPRSVTRDARLRLRLDRRAHHLAQVLQLQEPRPVHLRRGHRDVSGGFVSRRELHAERVLGRAFVDFVARAFTRLVRKRVHSTRAVHVHVHRGTASFRRAAERDDVHERRGEHGRVRRRSLGARASGTLAHGNVLAVHGTRRDDPVEAFAFELRPVVEGFVEPSVPGAARVRRVGEDVFLFFFPIRRERVRLRVGPRGVATPDARRDGAPAPARFGVVRSIDRLDRREVIREPRVFDRPGKSPEVVRERIASGFVSIAFPSRFRPERPERVFVFERRERQEALVPGEQGRDRLRGAVARDLRVGAHHRARVQVRAREERVSSVAARRGGGRQAALRRQRRVVPADGEVCVRARERRGADRHAVRQQRLVRGAAQAPPRERAVTQAARSVHHLRPPPRERGIGKVRGRTQRAVSRRRRIQGSDRACLVVGDARLAHARARRTRGKARLAEPAHRPGRVRRVRREQDPVPFPLRLGPAERVRRVIPVSRVAPRKPDGRRPRGPPQDRVAGPTVREVVHVPHERGRALRRDRHRPGPRGGVGGRHRAPPTNAGATRKSHDDFEIVVREFRDFRS